jgi:type I restriction-modification system DNA methylase subunit
MTIAITLLLASLLIIGILRTVLEFRGESPAEQVTESTAQAEEISEPQAEIIIENPPYQVEEKKTAQKESAPAKKDPVKKTPAKKTPAKKTTPKK